MKFPYTFLFLALTAACSVTPLIGTKNDKSIKDDFFNIKIEGLTESQLIDIYGKPGQIVQIKNQPNHYLVFFSKLDSTLPIADVKVENKSKKVLYITRYSLEGLPEQSLDYMLQKYTKGDFVITPEKIGKHNVEPDEFYYFNDKENIAFTYRKTRREVGHLCRFLPEAVDKGSDSKARQPTSVE